MVKWTPISIICLPKNKKIADIIELIKEYFDPIKRITVRDSGKFTYEEELFIIEFEIELEESILLERWYHYTIHKWCNKFKSQEEQSEFWLKFDSKLILELACYYDERERIVQLDAFALGNLVGLNTFVQHFHSNLDLESASTTQTIDNSNLHFDYFCMHIKFDVRFQINDTNGKKSCMPAKNFDLKFNYENIKKIIITRTISDERSGILIYLDCPALLYDVTTGYFRVTTFNDDILNNNFPKVGNVRNGRTQLDSIGLTTCVMMIMTRNEELTFLSHIITKYNKFIYYSPLQTIPIDNRPQNPVLHEKYYNCFYALKTVTSRSYEVADQLLVSNNLRRISAKLNKYAEINSNSLCNALYDIQLALSLGNIIFFDVALDILFDKHSRTDGEPEFDIPKNMIKCKQAVLTPTRIIFLPPLPTFQNRLIRSCDPEFCLKISVRDDNLKKLNFVLKGSEDEKVEFIKSKIKYLLLNGIPNGNRTYKVIGCSNSQLRSHNMLLYAKDLEGKTAENLRLSSGDLSCFKNPHQYLARMGLMFSQAIGCMEVPQKSTNVNNPEMDILTEKGAGDATVYNFSDGIGRISLDLAEEIYFKLNLQDKPSVFQIRYAGCKGMLLPEANMDKGTICFRESMKKYPSTSTSLEIIRTSKPTKLFLNRPLITIMEQMGVKPEVFLELQKSTIKKLFRSIMYDEDAADVLKQYSAYKLKFDTLLSAGVSFTSEPFFRSMIQAIYRSAIVKLKEKARIEIPFNKGRSMLGVLDERGVLEYGQVFVQYSDNYFETGSHVETKVLTGPVVVTRSPCLHPGDVRRLEAVDRPELHYIKDCIVFPAKGPRPHPNEMSGGDLDGDEYTVIWHKDLIFERDNYPPMDMPHFEPKIFHKPVELPDLLDVFCEYIVQDKVAIISNAHLSYADKTDGIFSTECMNLAKKCSISVDFLKTGIPATFDNKDRSTYFPDFMEKKHQKKTYQSRKVLGSLYRTCKMLEITAEETEDLSEFIPDKSFEREGWEEFRESAVLSLRQYTNAIHDLMASHNAESEGEVISGMIRNSLRHMEREEIFNLNTTLEYRVREIFKSMRSKFMDGIKINRNGEKDDGIWKKASAWYMVTFQQTSPKRTRCYGLPWIVYDFLIKIKNVKHIGKDLKKRNSFVETAMDKQLETAMDKQLEKLSLVSDPSEQSNVELVTKTLQLWINNNMKFFKGCSRNDMFKALEKAVDTVVRTKNIDEKNPASLILDCLEEIAQQTFFDLNLSDSSPVKRHPELGILSITTFVKLGLSCNLQYMI